MKKNVYKYPSNCFLFLLLCAVMMSSTVNLSCSSKEEVTENTVAVVKVEDSPEQEKLDVDMEKLTVLLSGELPIGNAKGEAAVLAQNILANKEAFLVDLEKVLKADEVVSIDGLYADTSFLLKADKKTSLPEGYIPPNIVKLTQESANIGNYLINRKDLSLRTPVEASLVEMAHAARADGVTLLVSSSYRSYDYQTIVYERNVAQSGQAVADRGSARPGRSQHQLGTVIDFGSITDAFAQTDAGKWMYENGPGFGWSLSFPQDYEEVTGYRWESWHWRYIGTEAVRFQEKWFKNIQQYMIEFIYAWNNL